MSDAPKILAFAGSLRKDSYNKKILKIAVAGAEKAGAKVTLIDLNDYEMPIYDGDIEEKDGFPPAAVELQKMLLEHDGLLIACPEYNGSLSGVLKNTLDWTSRAHGEIKTGECFKGKIAGTMVATPSRFGGLRCLAHLRDVFTVLLVNTLPCEVGIGEIHKLFNDKDEMTNDEMCEKLEDLGRQLTKNLHKTDGEIEVVEGTGNSASGCGQHSGKDDQKDDTKTESSAAKR